MLHGYLIEKVGNNHLHIYEKNRFKISWTTIKPSKYIFLYLFFIVDMEMIVSYFFGQVTMQQLF